MGDPRSPEQAPATPAGGGGWLPSPMFLVIAVALVSGGVAGWWLSSPSTPVAQAPAEQAVGVAPAAPAPLPVVAASAAPTAPVAVAAAPSSPAPLPPPPQRRNRDADGDQTPDLADYLNTGEHPPMAEVIDRLHAAGVHTGLAAFSPPGTRPPLVGLAVPEDFPLPEGYVRHYQVTDDGDRIEPILMFAPDRQFVDAAGRPIAIPKDRVVPPELALPGLPIRRVTIPAPTDPSRVRS